MDAEPDGLLNILEKHGAELHALLTRLTLRADVAEDLLQELFLKLRDAKAFARAENSVAYAFRTAINLAYDWRRARRCTVTLAHEPPTAAMSPADSLIRSEEVDQVLDALEWLSPVDREIVVMHYLRHQPYAEIAQTIKKTEHQVRGLCHKAVGRLRDFLGAAAGGPE